MNKQETPTNLYQFTFIDTIIEEATKRMNDKLETWNKQN